MWPERLCLPRACTYLGSKVSGESKKIFFLAGIIKCGGGGGGKVVEVGGTIRIFPWPCPLF